MIHVGKQETLKTLCGKPVARRWWIEDDHVEYGNHAGVPTYREIKVREEAVDCPKCLEVIRYRRSEPTAVPTR